MNHFSGILAIRPGGRRTISIRQSEWGMLPLFDGPNAGRTSLPGKPSSPSLAAPARKLKRRR